MKNIAIEFSFEILDSAAHEMRLKQHFSLVVGEESYRPVEVKVLETEAWKDEWWLEGYRMGRCVPCWSLLFRKMLIVMACC